MPSPVKRRPPPSALETLPPVVLATVIVRAGPRGAASLACASKTLCAAASSDERWRRFCADDIRVDAPIDPEGRVLPSFKVLSLLRLPPSLKVFICLRLVQLSGACGAIRPFGVPKFRCY
ncbi:unnamed protein product [Urochloa humidicola]